MRKTKRRKKKFNQQDGGALNSMSEGGYIEFGPDDGVATIFYPPSCRLKYVGGLENGKCHGKGILKDENNKTIYDGFWRNGYFHGEGSLLHGGRKHPGDSKGTGQYIGEFLDGKKNGKGILRWSDTLGNLVYDGFWKNDAPHGEGSMTTPTGMMLIGDFSVGKMTGKGILKNENNIVLYKGFWKNNRFHGRGGLLLNYGNVIYGDFSEGKIPVKGILKYYNGDVYSGDFLECKECKIPWSIPPPPALSVKKHGKGTLKYKNGDVYDGFWKNDSPHGKGSLTTTGKIFIGDFSEGMMTGKGILKNKNNIVLYDGFWKNYRFHGRGELLLNYGNVIYGDFSEGKIPVKGTLKYYNGDVYSGDFLECKECNLPIAPPFTALSVKKHGKGTLKYKNGDVYIGDFLEDKITGKGSYTFSAGTSEPLQNGSLLSLHTGPIDTSDYIGDFLDGKMHGKGKFISLVRDAEVIFDEDMKDGLESELPWGIGEYDHVSHDDDTVYIYKGEWKQDVKHGIGTVTFHNTDWGGEYDETKPYKLYRGEFKNGKRDGVFFLTPSRKLEQGYKHDKEKWEEGKLVSWTPVKSKRSRTLAHPYLAERRRTDRR